MKSKLLKFAGALAIVAVVGLSSISTTNAQPVSMDGVDINTVENFDEMLQKEITWTFVSKHYVYNGTQE